VAGDEGIAPGLFATVGSIAVSCNRGRGVEINFLNTGLLPETLESFKSFVQQFSWVRLVVHDVDLSPFEGAPLMKGSYSSYARILFRRYIKAERALYFDTDFLVFKDVSVLFDMDMLGATAWATMTPTIPYLNMDCPFYSPDEIQGVPYFNAGVILVDGNKWEEQKCEERVIAKLKTGIHLAYHDQTLLNYVLKDHWRRLPNEWGLMMIHNTKNPLDTNYHFGGGGKPWQASCTFISSGLWWAVYKTWIRRYYRVKNDALVRASVLFKESIAYYLLPLIGFAALFSSKLKSKQVRLRKRKLFSPYFRAAEKLVVEAFSGQKVY
jgi:lipopolysaccharide biosynthesis glycosyltransferase